MTNPIRWSRNERTRATELQEQREQMRTTPKFWGGEHHRHYTQNPQNHKQSAESRQNSDLKPHRNDRLSDHPQAGVVAASVPSHELVGLIDRDCFLMGGDPFGL